MSDRPRASRRLLVAAACALALATLARAAATSAPAAKAAKPAAPSPRDTMIVLDDVRRLASPAWEGRGIGTAGIDSAADWIAQRMKQAGLQPAGDSGSWFQSFEVTTGVVPEAPCA